MKITKKALIKNGFEKESYREWVNGSVCVLFGDDKSTNVFVYSRITFDESYARPAIGVKNEKDLVELIRLINGKI